MMTSEQQRWLTRATETAKQVYERPAIVREWATSCSDDERSFMIAVYQNRPTATALDSDGQLTPFTPSPDVPGFHTLPDEVRYMIHLACTRNWYR
jgi:hypothetical protein